MGVFEAVKGLFVKDTEDRAFNNDKIRIRSRLSYRKCYHYISRG